MSNHALEKNIQTMANVDQAARFHGRNSKGNLPPNLLVYTIDACHSYRMRNIIHEHGYPTTKLIGKEGMKNWWILVQHQDLDPDLQKKCLKRCDFAPNEHAFLMDRVLVNTGKPQRYGTQLNAPLIDRKKIETARRKLGLSSLEEYLTQSKRLAKEYQNQKKR